jgi:putative FmdB family regulatory protein
MTMPTYEYRCQRCGETFEQRESVAEHEAAKAKCPKCGSEEVARAYSAFYAKTSKKS